VDLANEAIREWEPLAQPRQPVVERSDVVRDLHDIVEWDSGCFIELEEEKVGERRLRALDLRREHGFLPDVGVEKKREVRKERRYSVETAECEQRGFESLLQTCVELERRARWQRGRHERQNALAC
jgi:hypothetical protein